MEQKYIKASDVAAMFGVTKQTIRNWIDKGLLKATNLDGCHYVTMASVKAIEDKYSDVVVEEGALEDYLKSLRTLAEEYRKSVDDYRSAITGNKSLTTTRHIIARFIPIVYDLLRDGLPTTKRGGLIIRRVIEGEDLRSIAQELDITYERVRQILEREMRIIHERASRYHTLKHENESLREEISALKLNAKNIEHIVGNVVERQTMKDLPCNILTKKLVDCDLSVRSLNCLKAYHEYVDGKFVDRPIETIGDLTRLHKTDLLKMRHFGIKSLIELDNFMKGLGLDWGKRYFAQNDGTIVEISSTI